MGRSRKHGTKRMIMRPKYLCERDGERVTSYKLQRCSKYYTLAEAVGLGQ
jgi:hypothetical protein